MDRLGSGILLDPTTGTGSAGAGGVRAWQRRQGVVKMGGGNHLPSPRREAGRRGALGSGVGGEGGSHVGRAVRAACARRLIRRPTPSPPAGRGFGGRGVKMAAGR